MIIIRVVWNPFLNSSVMQNLFISHERKRKKKLLLLLLLPVKCQ